MYSLSTTMRFAANALAGLALAGLAGASPYRDDLVDYNLNTNKNAADPTQYSTNVRTNTTYTPSPDNWRAIPFYTLLPDKFADGDPSNNDFFGTMYEYDWRETQIRSGGDLKGIALKLDYLAGMGIKGVFISGTPFLNMLWQADSASRFLIFLNTSLSANSITKVIPHSTFPSSIRTTGTSRLTRHLSTRYTPAECMSWLTSPSAPWPTSSALRGTSRGLAFLVIFLLMLHARLHSHLTSATTFDLGEYKAVWKDPKMTPWNFTEYKDFDVRPDAPLRALG